MWIIKKYNQRKRLRELVYKDFEKALLEKDYIRSGLLSKRFLKLNKNEFI